MINFDEDALICDFAETYHIYDYKSLSCKKAGVLACGLRSDSRVMMGLSGCATTTDQMLLASVVDNTRLIAWLQSEDGVNGTNRPKSILAQMMGEPEKGVVAFTSGKEFSDEWKRLTGGET